MMKTDSITELAHFWDDHDLTDFEDVLEEVSEPVFQRDDEAASLIHLHRQDAERLKMLANKESMANTSQGLAERDIQTLANIFKQYASVQAVYLFGSHAEGRPRTGSDIDLAVVPRRGAEPPNKLDLLTDLARTGFCNVDLLILDINDIVLAYEAVRLNRVIYQTDDFERGTLYSKVVRQYLDFKPYLDVQREAYKRRILSGQG